MEIIQFMFQNFWTFLGCMVLIWLPFAFLQNILTIWTHSRNVKIHGWPPVKDSKKETEKEDA